ELVTALSSGSLARLPFGDQRTATLTRKRVAYFFQDPAVFVPDRESDAPWHLRFLGRLDADPAAAQFPGQERSAVFLFEQLRRGIDDGRPFADQLAVLAEGRGVGSGTDGRVRKR